MKLPLKYIAILVIVALVGVFAYQTYWLVGLYQSQKKEMDEKVNSSLSYAHIMEMEKRVEKLRSAKQGPHGSVNGSVAFAVDHKAHTSSLRKVQVKKVPGGRTVIEVYSDSSSQEVSDNAQEQTLMLMMSGKLTTLVQQALFSKLNDISAPDIHVYDSLLVHKLMTDSLVNVNHAAQKEEYPHSVLFMRGKKVVERVASSGYVPTSDAVRYQHVVSNEGEPNEEKYVLIMEPIDWGILIKLPLAAMCLIK